MAVGTEPQLQVAIVGGGIIGLITAMGLLKRNISVKMYEQSRSFREIGAGVAFTANAMQCMELIDPAIVEAVNAVATPNGEDSENPNDYLRFHDGYNCDPSDPERTDDQLKALLHTGYRGFQGCHRAHLLDELVRHIPEHAVEFGKRFVGYEDRGSEKKLLIHFQDGTTAEADAAFVTEPSDWPVGDSNGVRNMTAEATREELEAVFQGWGPTVRNIVGLLPDEMDKWGIFDMYDHPAPSYVRGRVCVAGDAAHASSPHHGAGAGIGVEDALALCTLFDMITASLPQTLATSDTQQAKSLSSLVEAAFQVFDQVRSPRSQWLVKSSREACDIYEWNYPETKRDWDKCLDEITTRSHKLWYFDIDGMLKELQDGYHAKTATALAANQGTAI
ncbi:salicylate 1-monooxygenase SalA [Seiridium cupressi]